LEGEAMRVVRLVGCAVVALVCLASPAVADLIGDRKSEVAGRSYSGEVLDADLPGSLHIKNVGSKVDGKGMCVMSSIEMAAILAGMDEYRGLRDWCANEEGGGSPPKVDKQLAAFCRAKNLPAPKYLQYEGPDPGPIMEAAAKSGRLACITYGWSPRYKDEYGQVLSYIAHMVCLPKFSGKYAAVLDNNFPGENANEWMDRDELVRRSKFPRSTAWVFVWLSPPYPPSPRN
jgi:hypothetical protein